MAIELKNVTKSVDGSTHIYNTDLSLKEGSFNVLLGTTLAGKTTLMRLMAGLEKPTTGTVYDAGKNVTNVSIQKRSVSMVYQQFINYPNMSIFDNIASPLKVSKVSPVEIKARVKKLADLLQLTPMLDRLPRELSGGQQQRTAMARALIKNSKLVLLDEPLANLDYKLREELRDELPKLVEETGATIVYATSEPEEALLLGGYTTALSEGRVVQHGPALEVYNNPTDIVSAQVYSDPPINLSSIVKAGNEFIFSENIRWPVSQKYKHLEDGQYTLGVRPHHLTAHKQASVDSVVFSGVVSLVEINGSESVIRADVMGNQWVSKTHGVHVFNSGDPIQVYLHTEKCFYFNAQGKLAQPAK